MHVHVAAGSVIRGDLLATLTHGRILVDTPDVRGDVDLRADGSVVLWNVPSGIPRTIRWAQPVNQVTPEPGTAANVRCYVNTVLSATPKLKVFVRGRTSRTIWKQ